MKIIALLAVLFLGGVFAPSATASEPVIVNFENLRINYQISAYFVEENRPYLMVLKFSETVQIGNAKLNDYKDVCYQFYAAKLCEKEVAGTARIVAGKIYPLDGKKLPGGMKVRELIYQESNYVNDQIDLTDNKAEVKVNSEGEFWDAHLIPTLSNLPADMQEFVMQQIYVNKTLAAGVFMKVDRNKYSAEIIPSKSWFIAPTYPYKEAAMKILQSEQRTIAAKE